MEIMKTTLIRLIVNVHPPHLGKLLFIFEEICLICLTQHE